MKQNFFESNDYSVCQNVQDQLMDIYKIARWELTTVTDHYLGKCSSITEYIAKFDRNDNKIVIQDMDRDFHVFDTIRMISYAMNHQNDAFRACR